MNSPTTVPTSAKPMLMRNVLMMAGNADGTTTLRKIWRRVAPSDTIIFWMSGSVSLAAWNAASSATMDVSDTDRATFEMTPVPNHRMTSGAKAILGTLLIATRKGSTTRAA
ncbi:hypothetical protein G6F50_018056 [Rhizopus delemar]|uniref:Uncharacterized protein n=1 Tax=Rhizopus delemar TaxID=936053 RepID=A0A9P6XPB8_9FUNG|nr:hypothetical protein G6F50_018056 [Rhizopus delemar]